MIDAKEVEALIERVRNDPEGLVIEGYASFDGLDFIRALLDEREGMKADADLFRLIVSTCDALDANAFDASNQPGTLRIVCKHKTQTYPELQMKIVDLIEGYKTRVDAARQASKEQS